MKNYLNYLLVRLFGWLISHFSYKNIYRIGTALGSLAFEVHRSFRKKAMTSLAIAYGETLSERERRNIARRSFQNLMITCLEFFRLKKSMHKMHEIVHLKNNPNVVNLLNQGQAVIFLSAHQANWEIPFLALTEKWQGIAIGRPINNPYIYKYVMSVREMHGGHIIMPKEATKAGMTALKEGTFLGIVGDQAYPTSSYSYPLLGTRAFTAATPALLAYRARCPIVVGSCRRLKGHYIVSGSDPIWPDVSKPLREEIPRMMNLAMSLMEKSIQQYPQQWMWVHDRYKQMGINYIKREFRYSFLLIILPSNSTDYIEGIELLQKLYERAFITVFVPKGVTFTLPGTTILHYENKQELYTRDWRHQLLFDFYESKSIRKHYKRLGVFVALHLKKMKSISGENKDLIQIIKKTVVKKECLNTVSI
jgi:KDO2-lipid IV(A) lauroyltransferase